MSTVFGKIVLFLWPLLCAAFWLLPASEAAAEKRQYGNVVYEVPQGWVQGGTWNGFQVLHPAVPAEKCDFCAIYIGAGAKAAGTLEEFIAENRTAFIAADYRAAARPGDEPTFYHLNGNKAGMVSLYVAEEVFVFAAVEVGDRFQTFGFEGSVVDNAQQSRTMEIFETDFAPFLQTAGFISDGAASVIPEARSGDLDGLWWGVKTRWYMGLGGMMQMHQFHSTLVFWPDGHFYRGTPPLGLREPDSEELLASANPDFGIYSLNGGTLTLTFTDGHTETAAVEGDKISLDGTELYPAEPLADGETLNGSIGAIFFDGFTPGTGLEGGVAQASYTTFRPDGTYEGASSGGASMNFETLTGDLTGGFTSGSGQTVGGTYEIRDGLIVSRPNDGSTPRIVLVFRAGDSILVGDRFLETD